jgi:hypothetical protein
MNVISGEVTDIQVFNVDEAYEFIYDGGSIISSDSHNHIVRLWDTNEVRILKTVEITDGDRLITEDGEKVIDSIRVINNPTTVINLEVDSKIYVTNGIITHNKQAVNLTTSNPANDPLRNNTTTPRFRGGGGSPSVY